jgi:predicted MFS family arabinose efflux permease
MSQDSDTAADTALYPATFVTALLLGAALNPINDTLIATALVPIAHNFGVSAGSTALLVSAAYLAGAVAQPSSGKLAEQLGPRRVFLTGVLLVLVGGVLGALSMNLTVLACARVIIALGTSAGYPSAMFMIRRRAQHAGLLAPPGNILAALAVVGLSFIAIGPPLGGALVATLGWRAIFFLNVPLSLATVAFILIGVPRDPPLPHQGMRDLLSRIDLPGIGGFAVLMAALLTFLLSIPTPRWGALGAAVAFGFCFVLWEIRAAHPFFDVRELVSNGPLTLTYVRMTFGMLGVFVLLYGLPQWLQAAHGYSPDAAGLVMLPLGIVSAIVSTLASRSGRVRGPLLAAGVATAVGGVMMLGLGPAGLPYSVLAITTVLGVTLGATQGGSQLALYVQAAPERVATSAGLLRTFHYFGAIGASVVTGITFHHAVSDSGLHLIAWIVASLGVIVVVITLLDRSLSRPAAAAPWGASPRDAASAPSQTP